MFYKPLLEIHLSSNALMRLPAAGLDWNSCVGFDNRRVLHARTAFNFEADAHQVGRHLKGLYVSAKVLYGTSVELGPELCAEVGMMHFVGRR